MKTFFYFFVFLLISIGFSACEENADDYHTEVFVTLQTPDTLQPLKVQGTMTLKNLSNGRRYHTSDFQHTTAQLSLLRGAYSLDVEGTMIIQKRNGTTEVKYFRGSKDYVEIIAHPVRLDTQIIFM